MFILICFNIEHFRIFYKEGGGAHNAYRWPVYVFRGSFNIFYRELLNFLNFINFF